MDHSDEWTQKAFSTKARKSVPSNGKFWVLVFASLSSVTSLLVSIYPTTILPFAFSSSVNCKSSVSTSHYSCGDNTRCGTVFLGWMGDFRPTK